MRLWEYPTAGRAYVPGKLKLVTTEQRGSQGERRAHIGAAAEAGHRRAIASGKHDQAAGIGEDRAVRLFVVAIVNVGNFRKAGQQPHNGARKPAVRKTHFQSSRMKAGWAGYAYRDAVAADLLVEGLRFPVINALEVIEHVPDPAAFIAELAALLEPGGLLFLSTINRTKRSFVAAKVAAEYVLRWLPVGTHDWRKFIRRRSWAASARERIGVDRHRGRAPRPAARRLAREPGFVGELYCGGASGLMALSSPLRPHTRPRGRRVSASRGNRRPAPRTTSCRARSHGCAR